MWLVLGCIVGDFESKYSCDLGSKYVKALAEIYTIHSFALLESNLFSLLFFFLQIEHKLLIICCRKIAGMFDVAKGLLIF